VRNFIEPQARKIKKSTRALESVLEQHTARPPSALAAAERDTSLRDSTADETDEIWNSIYRHSLQSRKKTYIQVADARGKVIYRSFNLGADSLVIADSLDLSSTQLTTGALSDEPIRIAALRTGNFTYLVGYPLGEVRDLLDSLYVIFLVLIPIAVLVSVIGGFALARKSLQPVDELARAAERITAQNLDQPLPIPHPHEEIGRLAATINDMTRRLHDTFARMSQFSADASHELRTPLTVVRGEIELALRSSRNPAEYRRVLETTLEEVLRMGTIVENLLLLAKADQKSYQAHFTEVGLHELLEELVEDGEVLAEHKKITLKVARAVPVTIVGDKVRLRQLFLNLLDNAIKYTPEGGRVTLAVEQQNGSALFRVEDTGIGIPPEETAKIFERFYRVDKARSRELGGSGLGLAIARWIAELHRGTITVSSRLNEGSVFTVVLPLS
jgi:heavy metal sensor kinase